MTYPSIEDTNTSAESDNVTTHTVNLPPNISANDLLLIFFSCDGDETVTFSDGFTKIMEENNGPYNTLAVAYKWASGSEGSTTTVTTGTTERSAHITYRIENHSTSIAPELAHSIDNDAYPDPPNLTPTSGAKDYLWIAVMGCDDDEDPVSYPAGMTLGRLQKISNSGSGTTTVATAARQDNVSSYDPYSFELPTGEQWNAATIAVHPNGAPPPTEEVIVTTMS